MRGLLARANGNAASRSTEHDPSPPNGLTRRELEVLGLLAEGLDQGEISSKLVISSKTVGTHIQRILVKLDVHSRAQAVAAAHRAGLAGSTP